MKSQLTLDALLVLDTIHRRGSFAAAAEELHRVPSAITYTIQKLEQGLNTALFDRQGHRAQLTPAGETLLEQGRDLLLLAEQTERHVRRVATGWEGELRIAVGDLIPMGKVLQLCDEFSHIAPSTHITLTTEVLSGTWDALLSGRADLLIGAPSDGPSGGGYSTHPLGDVEFLFVVAPHHPLAGAQEPLPNRIIRQHRVVAAADSSRSLPTRSYGLLPGQQVLTVPDLQVKREAQILGLGVGHLPYHLIKGDLDAGRLIQKQTEDQTGVVPRVLYAWRPHNLGKGLQWFLQRLCKEHDTIEWFHC